jgi:tRNA A-37 threonylcarbamoyl transferase component Bud32
MDELESERLALQLFGELCALPRQGRDAVIEARCGDNSILRKRVEALLNADQEPIAAFCGEVGVDGFLNASIQTINRDVAVDDEQTARVPGHYRLLRVLGEGGMATVYEAEQVHPRRLVAIKVIRGGFQSPELRRRFEYEAQVLAGLQHPGIAQLYEAETRHERLVGDGRIRGYLAMELVRGSPIDEFATLHRLDVAAKLQLIILVCDAVEYAHRMGVVHRDLKPANILVDSTGRPKVLDFGVARVVQREQNLTAAVLTQAGQLVGTLPYMSPEQVDEKLGVADTRCDVYALGVLLYKLLAGTLPIDLEGEGIGESLRRICNDVPLKLGVRDRRLRGDLEVIVAKALEKDPARRYHSVEALADDLRRFLSARPIEARGDSALYVLKKAAWRFRQAVVAVSAFLVLLGCFAVYAKIQASRSARLAADAVKARDQSIAAKDTADTLARDLRHSLYLSNIGFAQSALGSHDVARARALLDFCPTDLRGWEWRYLQNQLDQSDSVRSLNSAAPSAFDLSSDRSRLAVGTTDGAVLVNDNSTGRTLYQRRFPTGGLVAVAISPDGNRLACGPRMEDLSVVDLPGGRQLWSPPPPPPPKYDLLRRLRVLRFSPDGKILASAGYDGHVRLRDAATGEFRADLDHHCLSVLCLAFSGDGKVLAAGDNIGVVRLWRVSDGALLHETRAHDDAIAALAISSDDRQLATGGSDGRVCVRSLETWAESARLRVGDCIV